MSYERLMSEHQRIDKAIVRLRKLIESDLPDVAAVVIALSDLSAELGSHLAHEDSFIYPRMIAGSNAESSQTARAFVSEFADLTRDWNLYLSEWSWECIQADWKSFRAETDRMMGRLALRVRAENNLLYSIALKNNAIHLRERRKAA